MRTALKTYAAAAMLLGAWTSREADLNPWQAAATIILSPAILAAAAAHQLRCIIFER